jgi:hypothetical protein
VFAEFVDDEDICPNRQLGRYQTDRSFQCSRVKPAATRGSTEVLTDTQDGPFGQNLNIHVAWARISPFRVDLNGATAPETARHKLSNQLEKDQVGASPSGCHCVG